MLTGPVCCYALLNLCFKRGISNGYSIGRVKICTEIYYCTITVSVVRLDKQGRRYKLVCTVGRVGFTGATGRTGDRGDTGWTGRQGFTGGTGPRGQPAAQLGGTSCIIL